MTDPYVDTPRLQGTILSGKSWEFDFGFGPLSGTLKFGAEETRERKVVKGARRDGKPLGLTVGNYEPPKIEVSFVATTGKYVQEQLTANGQGSIGDAVSTIVMSGFEPDIANDGPITVTFDNCVLVGRRYEGRDADSEESLDVYTFQTTSVDQDGMVLYSVQRGV